MKRWHFYVLIGSLCVMGGIQFIPSAKNLSTEFKNADISTVLPVPEDVHHILSTSCFDCHSDRTRYPWYAKIQPIRWWLASNVKEGKQELNFDEFALLSPRRQYEKIKEIKYQISKNEMPLSSYSLMHRIAILSPEQRDIIIHWCESIRDTMKPHFLIDSLE